MGRLIKNLGLYLILVVLVVSLVNVFLSPAHGPQQSEAITYSEFLTAVDTGQVKSITIKENTISGRL